MIPKNVQLKLLIDGETVSTKNIEMTNTEKSCTEDTADHFNYTFRKKCEELFVDMWCHHTNGEITALLLRTYRHDTWLK